MTPLAMVLAERIDQTGPITVADFMAECLTHPVHGYYTTRDPLGAAGDFTTAPEISQMFGELIGAWLATVWLDQGRPDPFALVELGPGRGTLMSDALRAASRVPGFAAAARLTLVEASPPLRARQAEALRPCNPAFVSSLADVPDDPLFLVANEFFDALPIRQYVRAEAGWAERMVTRSGDGLAFALAPAGPVPDLAHRLADTGLGDLVERCQPAEAVAADIGHRLNEWGGAALIIDYGGWISRGDTLQAVRGHTPVDPLVDAGDADLTAHVDFAALARAATRAGAVAEPLTAQGVFLERLGITSRARALGAHLGGEALQSHIAAHRRLTHPEEMGTLFQVLGLRAGDAPPLPGLNDNPAS